MTDGRQVTESTLVSAVARLAVPSMGAMVLSLLFNLTDLYWVGRLGTPALAAVGAGSFVYWILNGLAHVASVGTVARAARSWGAGDGAAARQAGATGLWLGTVIALAAALVGLPLIGPMAVAQGFSPATVADATAYLGTILVGYAAISGFIVVESIFRAAGDTLTPMGLVAVFVALNFGLDPLLMWGAGPIPPLGIRGVALATVATNAVGLGLGLVLLRRRGLLPTGRVRLPQWADLRHTARLGVPIAVAEIFFSLIYVALVPMLTRFGPAPVAALGIGHRIEGLAYAISVGIGAATATLVGQALGAGRIRRARSAAWLSAGLAASLMGMITVALWFDPEGLVARFSADPGVIAAGASYLRIASLCLSFQAVEIVLEGAFSGAGDPWPPLVISAPLTLARLPLAAWLIGRGWGADGVWVAIAVTAALKGVVAAVWFNRGGWINVHRRAARRHPLFTSTDSVP